MDKVKNDWAGRAERGRKGRFRRQCLRRRAEGHRPCKRRSHSLALLASDTSLVYCSSAAAHILATSVVGQETKNLKRKNEEETKNALLAVPEEAKKKQKLTDPSGDEDEASGSSSGELGFVCVVFLVESLTCELRHFKRKRR